LHDAVSEVGAEVHSPPGAPPLHRLHGVLHARVRVLDEGLLRQDALEAAAEGRRRGAVQRAGRHAVQEGATHHGQIESAVGLLVGDGEVQALGVPPDRPADQAALYQWEQDKEADHSDKQTAT